MTGGHQGTTTVGCLVHGAVVVLVVIDVLLEARLEPDHRALDKEHLWV